MAEAATLRRLDHFGAVFIDDFKTNYFDASRGHGIQLLLLERSHRRFSGAVSALSLPARQDDFATVW